MAVNVYQWMNKNNENYSKIQSILSPSQIKYAFK